MTIRPFAAEQALSDESTTALLADWCTHPVVVTASSYLKANIPSMSTGVNGVRRGSARNIPRLGPYRVQFRLKTPPLSFGSSVPTMMASSLSLPDVTVATARDRESISHPLLNRIACETKARVRDRCGQMPSTQTFLA